MRLPAADGAAVHGAHDDNCVRSFLQLTVLTCMDSRLIPERFLGLDIGDAEIIRNGGGRVTLDVLR